MTRLFSVASVATTAGAITGAATGDAVMAWAMTVCNIAILIANTAIVIYRKFRDRDDDKKKGGKDDEENVE